MISGFNDVIPLVAGSMLALWATATLAGVAVARVRQRKYLKIMEEK